MREHRAALSAYGFERDPVEIAHRLDEHVDLAAAGEANGERELVTDPVIDDARAAVLEGGHSLLVHGGFDAAVAHRARDPVPGARDERGAERPRRRSRDAHDGRDRDRLARREPLLELDRDLSHRVAVSAAAGSARNRRRQPSPQK